MFPFEQNYFHQRWLINIPPVYRYMDNYWIQKFFETGQLRLTSYQKFREENNDEIRGDEQEGSQDYIIKDVNGERVLTLNRSTGDHNFIFCTSLRHDKELMSSDNFDCDGCFKIKNTQAFAFEIAKKINQFVNGLEGPAIYTLTGQVEIELKDYGFANATKAYFDSDKNFPRLFKVAHEISERDFSLFFSKREKYKNQSEYRFIWAHLQPTQPDHIILEVPEAVKFCEWLTIPKP